MPMRTPSRPLVMALLLVFRMLTIMELFRPTFRFTMDRTEPVGIGPLFLPVTAMA